MVEIPRYHVIGQIAQGAYGVVFKAMDVSDSNRTVALKRIELALDEDGIPPTAIREIALLKELRHENVIQLLDVVHAPYHLDLVFHFVDSDLKRCMESQVRGLSLPTIKWYASQLLSGLSYCHGCRVSHRDLKPENLLVELRIGRLLLADFGLSCAFRLPDRTHTREVVTLWYRAPELLLGATRCTPAIDLWSVGCILAEMLRGAPLFPGQSEVDQLFSIFIARGTPNGSHGAGLASLPCFQRAFPQWRARPLAELLPDAPAEALDLIERLLDYDPAARLSAREALSHPFLKDVAGSACAPDCAVHVCASAGADTDASSSVAAAQLPAGASADADTSALSLYAAEDDALRALRTARNDGDEMLLRSRGCAYDGVPPPAPERACERHGRRAAASVPPQHAQHVELSPDRSADDVVTGAAVECA